MGKGVCLNGVIPIPVTLAKTERIQDLRNARSSLEGKVWLWKKGYGRREFTFKFHFSLGRKRMIELSGWSYLSAAFHGVIMVQREVGLWSASRKIGVEI